MDSSESIGVYGEAKAEYTRQLCNFLVPALETYFLDLLTTTKETEKDTKRILWSFQDALKQFPDWNMDKVQRETVKISESTKCDYLEEILTAVFIAHTKVLSAIRLTSKQKKLDKIYIWDISDDVSEWRYLFVNQIVEYTLDARSGKGLKGSQTPHGRVPKSKLHASRQYLKDLLSYYETVEF